MVENFEVVFLDEAADFIDRLDANARNKILYNIRKAQANKSRDLFKKLTNEIWELRTLFNNQQFRLFAFWDKSDHKNTLVISTHGIIKKTGKIARKEIVKAKHQMDLYFLNKGGKK